MGFLPVGPIDFLSLLILLLAQCDPPSPPPPALLTWTYNCMQLLLTAKCPQCRMSPEALTVSSLKLLTRRSSVQQSYCQRPIQRSVEQSVVVNNPSITEVSCDPRVISTSFLFLTPANEWHLLLRNSGRMDPGPEMTVFVPQRSGMRLKCSTSCMPYPVNEILLLIRWGFKVSSISFSSLSRRHSESCCPCSGPILLCFLRGSKPLSSEKACGWTQLIVDIPRPNFKMVSESRCFNPSFVIFLAISLGQTNSWWIWNVDLIDMIQSHRNTKMISKQATGFLFTDQLLWKLSESISLKLTVIVKPLIHL